MQSSVLKLRIAALTGFLGVALGAFGAHALNAHLEAGGYMETWRTAVHYHLIHVVVMLSVGLFGSPRLWLSYWFMFAGIVIFCGSLYLLAVTRLTWLGAITPIGGIAFMLGWGMIFIKSRDE
ncbi:MAG: DUF423 domain-containing protein [Verrucomicrobiaceae bacterium]|nr:DUF423 domain-containing protein [Verrucomicrobiaceae bacterium]